VSNFLANLGRRGAGLAPVIAPRGVMAAAENVDLPVELAEMAAVPRPESPAVGRVASDAAPPVEMRQATRSSNVDAARPPKPAVAPPEPFEPPLQRTIAEPNAARATPAPPVRIAAQAAEPAPVAIAPRYEIGMTETQVRPLEPAFAAELPRRFETRQPDPPAGMERSEPVSAVVEPRPLAERSSRWIPESRRGEPSPAPAEPSDATPHVEVTIGRIVIEQPAPPPAPRSNPPRGFSADTLARRYLNRSWY
jgi:hypothetical protein